MENNQPNNSTRPKQPPTPNPSQRPMPAMDIHVPGSRSAPPSTAAPKPQSQATPTNTEIQGQTSPRTNLDVAKRPPAQTSSGSKQPIDQKEKTNEQAGDLDSQKPSQPSTNHKSPAKVIAVILIVAFMLSALAVLAYKITNGSTSQGNLTSDNTNSESQTVTDQISQTIQAIDDNLNSLNETQNLSEKDFSDESLGF